MSSLSNKVKAIPRDISPSRSPVISVRGLTKAYGEKLAVDGLTFEVGGQKVTGFLGPNGAGKTTTLRIIVGLAEPTSGMALILDHPYARLARPGSQVGVLIETAEFHPARTARNHLRVLADAAPFPAPRVDEVLHIVGLEAAADRRVGGFSMGMKQRLGLAAALLGDPQLLVLDEPANGLDPRGISWLRDFLRAFARDGKAVFVSSHVLGEVALMADEVIVIDRGRLVVQARMDDLRSARAAVVTVRASDPDRLLRALSDAGREAVTSSGDELIVSDTTSEEVGTIAAAAEVIVYALQAQEPTLEDIFLELTAQEKES